MYFTVVKLAQYLQINQCDAPHKQIIVISIDAENSFEKIQQRPRLLFAMKKRLQAGSKVIRWRLQPSNRGLSLREPVAVVAVVSLF